MVQYQLPMSLLGAAHRRGGGGSTKLLVMLNQPSQGFKNFFTKIEAYAGMAERLVRDLEIEEALQDEIKETLEQKKTVICRLVCYTRQGKKRTRLNLPLHMIWADRRDHMVGDMTPLAGMPSSLVGEARGSF